MKHTNTTKLPNGRGRGFTLCLVAGIACSAWAERAFANGATVKADAGIQGAVADYANADNVQDRQAALEVIRQSASASPEHAVRQLAYASSRAKSTKKALAVGAVFHQLDLPDVITVQALVPLLETDDAALAKSVGSILGGLEGQSASRPPDFSIYRDIVEQDLRAGGEPADGLVRHMYATDPGEALLVMMRAHQLRQPAEIKTILWAEHTVANVLWKQRYGFLKPEEIEPAATEELSKMASHPAWWARLYAAAIMEQHPAFRQDDVINRLASDENLLVREIASRIANQP